jgi:HK97 family phage major capsid protein
MDNKFSLLKTIRDYTEGRKFSDESLEVMTAGQKDMQDSGISYRGQIQLPYEFRGIINATTNTGGQYTVATDVYNLLGALRGALVAVKAGATFLSGLKNDIQIPIYSGTTSLWKGENTTAVDGAGAFTDVTLAPLRLTTFIDVSKMFLNQDSTSSEALLMDDIKESILHKLEASIFDANASGSGRPAGMLYGVTNTSTGATTFAKVVALETAIEGNNALTGTLAYVTTPALRGVGKTTQKATYAASFLIDGGGIVATMNGYPIYSTSHMASGRMIFGNFKDLIIANWGSLDILVDPYTQAALGAVRLVVNSYWNFARRRDVSFAYASLT